MRSINILAGPSNTGDIKLYIRAADGHLMRGEDDLDDVVGGPESATTTQSYVGTPQMAL